MGKGKRRRATATASPSGPQVAVWNASAAARRVTGLLVALSRVQPGLLDVLASAVDQHVADVNRRAADAPDPEQAALVLSTLGVGTGLRPPEVRARVADLGAAMRRPPLDPSALLARLHEIVPQGQPYPGQTEAFVISPEMHNVVIAAAMTVTQEDLFTLDPDTDPPAPAGILLFPTPCGNPDRVYAPISVIGWRPQPGWVRPEGPSRSGLLVEGWSLRTDLDRRPLWAVAVRASRIAGVPAPPGVPVASAWLVNGDDLGDTERATIVAQDLLNDSLQRDRAAGSAQDAAEYDPEVGLEEFHAAAYAFAFWRLCRQTTADIQRHNPDRPDPPVGRSPGRQPSAVDQAVDRVRVVHLRPTSRGAGDERRPQRYHHRWPVRMHKVRQFYPSQNTHKVIWRGPYIKGPDGAPLLVGGKAQALT